MNVCQLQGKRYNEMRCKIFKIENNICINLFRLKMSQWAKRRRYNVETASELTSKRRCKNVENANRSDVDCKTLLQRH